MRISDWSSDVCSSDLFAGERIDVESLGQAVADSARFEAFDLNDRILDGDATGAVRSLQRLREEGLSPLEILGALSWCLRSLSKAAINFAKVRDAATALEMAGVRRFQQAKYLKALPRSEEHTSELQSLMRISYAVFCLKTKTN